MSESFPEDGDLRLCLKSEFSDVNRRVIDISVDIPPPFLVATQLKISQHGIMESIFLEQ